MAARKQTPAQRVTALAARRVSWMSLVAATTLGIGAVDQVRARISAAEVALGEGEFRLIVQSYRKGAVNGDARPQQSARPLASVQRSVTAEELHSGINVSLLQLPAEGIDGDSVVVAWVERGAPNLDYDALEARPREGAYYGVARHKGGAVVLRMARG